MHPSKKEEFLKKGWTTAELKKVENILEKKEPHIIFFSKMNFWVAFTVTIIANLMVSFVLFPFLIVLNNWMVYLITIILAGIIGFIYNFLITDIGHLEKKHHLLAGILLPIIALTNTIVVVLLSNKFIIDLNIPNPPHNPIILGIIFAFAFITPYLIHKLLGKHHLEK